MSLKQGAWSCKALFVVATSLTVIQFSDLGAIWTAQVRRVSKSHASRLFGQASFWLRYNIFHAAQSILLHSCCDFDLLHQRVFRRPPFCRQGNIRHVCFSSIFRITFTQQVILLIDVVLRMWVRGVNMKDVSFPHLYASSPNFRNFFPDMERNLQIPRWNIRQNWMREEVFGTSCFWSIWVSRLCPTRLSHVHTCLMQSIRVIFPLPVQSNVVEPVSSTFS